MSYSGEQNDINNQGNNVFIYSNQDLGAENGTGKETWGEETQPKRESKMVSTVKRPSS